MKNILKLSLSVAVAALFFSSCDKVKDLPKYGSGKSVVLTSSATTIAAAPADSNNTAVTFTWTDPAYAQDKSLYKYVIEIDSTNGDFLRAKTKTVTGDLTGSFTAKEINNILLGYGFAFNEAHNIYVRVVSSYGNSNESYASNVITISAAAYIIPPKIALPANRRLYIVGDATVFGWDNPNPMPANREFTRLDSTTWGGIFNFNGGGGYKILQTPGNWDDQFRMVTGGTSEGGSFVQENSDPTFPGPASGGWYKVILNFQSGTFMTASSGYAYSGTPPNNLYIVGDATAKGWDNPSTPEPTQTFTKLADGLFELTLPLNGGKSYLLLPVTGDWGHKFGGTDKSFGGILVDGDVPGANTPAPDETGTYKITVDFGKGTYLVEKQ